MSDWTRFERQLAERLAELKDVLVLEVFDSGEMTPYVQFAAYDDDDLRAEVSSNRFLASRWKLDAARRAALIEQGWLSPNRRRDGSPNFFIDSSRADAPALARACGRALRDAFGVCTAESLMVDPVTDQTPTTTGALSPEVRESLMAGLGLTESEVFDWAGTEVRAKTVPVPSAFRDAAELLQSMWMYWTADLSQARRDNQAYDRDVARLNRIYGNIFVTSVEWGPTQNLGLRTPASAEPLGVSMQTETEP